MFWTIEEERVNIIMKNTGIINFVFQKLFKKPKTSTVHLDEIGSFVWGKIDGIKTVEEIGAELEENFKNRVVPVYERLEKFLITLKEYNFIKI